MLYLDRFYIAPSRFRPGSLNAHLLATLFVAIATELRIAVGSSVSGLYFITFIPAIVATAMICGVEAGLFAVAASALCAWYFLIAPEFSFRIDSPREIYGLLVFTVIAGVIVIVIGAMRAAVERSRSLIQVLTTVLEASPDAILLTDRQGRITNVNRQAGELFRCPRDKLINAPLESLLPEPVRGRHALHQAAYMADPRPRKMGSGADLLALRGDGTEVEVDIRIAPVQFDNETRAITTVRDVSEFKAMHRALAESHERHAVLEERRASDRALRGALENTTDNVIILDREWRLTYLNEHAKARGGTGHDLVGQMVWDIIPWLKDSAVGQAWREAMLSGIPVHVEDYLTPDQAYIEGHAYPSPDGLTVFYRDVTKRKNAELALLRMTEDLTARLHENEELVARLRLESDAREAAQARAAHAERVRALGELTGGMAHDFNNLLGVIILNLDVAQRMLVGSDPMQKLIVNALAAARSGAGLIRSLLAFARRQPLVPVRIVLNEQVSSMHNLLSRTLGEDIEIVVRCAPDLWPVIADPSQVEACIMNLATNARDAMPKGGRLVIATSNQSLDADHAKRMPSAAPGDYAVLAVSDTGVGMTPGVMARAFEPFFSTKEVGKGTGLGLSMVFGFAQQSGGHVSIHSAPGVGTTIRLYLPRAPNGSDTEAPAKSQNPSSSEQGHGETVLVVEDDPALRQAVVQQLAALNYRVTESTSAPAALRSLEKKKVDLVFSDVVMPGGIDGFEFVQQAGARWPEVRTLLTSGFSERQAGRNPNETTAPTRLLSKPYDLGQLARAVREALDWHPDQP